MLTGIKHPAEIQHNSPRCNCSIAVIQALQTVAEYALFGVGVYMLPWRVLVRYSLQGF